MTLLIRHSDFEMNPSPDENTQILLKQILEGQTQIAADVTQIKSNQAALESKLDGFELHLAAIDFSLSQLFRLDNKARCLEDIIVALELTVAQLTAKHDDL